MSRSPLCSLALIALLSHALPAQFETPYSGVGKQVRSTPLPVVVMCYEPDTPIDDKRMCFYGRSGSTAYQVAMDRGSNWYKPIALKTPLAVVDDPVPMRHEDGSVSLFVLCSNQVVYQATTQRHEYIGTWSSFAPLPSNVNLASSAVAVPAPGGSGGVTAVAVGTDRRLYNSYYSNTAQSWSSWSMLPRSPVLQGRPTVWNSSDRQKLHVVCTDSAGIVRHIYFQRGIPGGWSAWSTLPTAPGTFRPSPTSYVFQNLTSVLATGTDGQVYQSLLGSSGWSSWSSLGGSFASGPMVVNSRDGERLDIYARDSAGTLHRRVYNRSTSIWTNWGQITTGVNWSGTPSLHNWHTRTMTQAEIREQLFGAAASVDRWFTENSFGKFRIREAYISPWLVMPDDPKTGENESSYQFFHGSNYAKKAELMIQGLEQLTPFRFGAYDSAPKDGKVTIDELMVYWIYPGAGARVRGAPTYIRVPSLGNGAGVSLSLGLPRSGAHTPPATITEELCHALFGLDDLYPTNQLPNYVGPGGLTLISDNSAFPHLHPWGKLKLGWVTPKVVTSDGWYELKAIEKHDELLVLHNPAKGTKDYFLVENRWPPGSIEHALPDRGLGVWRISEHFNGQAHWGRKTIHLLRAGGGTDDRVAFFDGGDARTSYHLTPSSVPASSRWLDNSSSEIAIYHVPSAGSSMRVFVDVPPLLKSPPPKYAAASINYIDQRAPFANPSPNWLVAASRPVVGSSFRIRVPSTYFSGSEFVTHFLVLGFTGVNVTLPIFDGYLYASIDNFVVAGSGLQGTYQQLAVPIPQQFNLVGLPFYMQVLQLRSSQGTPMRLSRGLRGVAGY